MFQCPLRAGDRREVEVHQHFTREPLPGVRARPAGTRVQVWRTIRVAGWEDVEVPAGKFRALLIESRNISRRLDISVPDARSDTQIWHAPRGRRSSPRQQDATSDSQMWYAPEVKRWVKLVIRRAGSTVTEELVEYRVR